MQYCNNCGNQMDDESKYCNKCGAALGTVIEKAEATKEQPIPNNLPPPQPQYEKSKNNKGCLMVFLWVFFLPIMAIITIAKSKKLSKLLKVVFISIISLFCIIVIVAASNSTQQRAETTFNEIKIVVDDKEYVKAQEQLNQFLKDYPNYKQADEAKALLELVNPEVDKIKAAEKAAAEKAAADKVASEKAAAEKAATEKAAADKAVADKVAADKAAADKAAADKIAYDTGITYNQLARTPDKFKGEKVKFTGLVIQVVEGDNETDLRIAVNDNYDNVLYVAYDPKISDTRVLENDHVTIKGVSQGVYTYESTLGGSITVPLVLVDIITID